MHSMTGFGRSACEMSGRRYVVEVRTVNHRFLDLKCRLPWSHPELESLITATVRKRLDRGAVSLTVAEESGSAPQLVRANVDFARKIHSALSEIARAVGTPPPTLELVTAQAGVLVVGEAIASAEALFKDIEPCLEEALIALTASRRREGATTSTELLKRLATLETIADELERLAASAPSLAQKRLRERLAKIQNGDTGPVVLDPQRVAQEIALIADRLDITEELVRLRAHLGQLKSLVNDSVPVGRKLDFLLQEVSREVNTSGSKSQSVDIARLIVEAKAEIEKIREQVQNVE